MKKINLLIIIICILCFIASPALAKKKRKKKAKPPAVQTEVQKRISNLSTEDKRLYNALSNSQQKKISKGKIAKGFNTWMVKLTLGDPVYGTEHHPIYTDYEEVWLYAKPEVSEHVREEKIFDQLTRWPTIHRTTRKKTCMIGDFFLLWDRGIVEKIVPTKTRKPYGSCTIETSEAFLPIVNGKAVEPKRLKD